MGRLAGFSCREVARKLRTFGFAFDRPGPGSHEVWRNPQTGRKITLPHHNVTWRKERFAQSCARRASTSIHS
jgi:predicted RNA binding protein YcfA (HicA-like mRNA interferase family)